MPVPSCVRLGRASRPAGTPRPCSASSGRAGEAGSRASYGGGQHHERRDDRAPPAAVAGALLGPGLARGGLELERDRESALAKSPARWYRSAGDFASALRITASTPRGQLRPDDTRPDGAGVARCRARTACGFGSGERRLARQHLVGHAAEGVHVGACGRRWCLPVRLLGAHVLRRSDDADRYWWSLSPSAGERSLRDPEVGHQRPGRP